jgi:hypothetical protein
MKLPADFRNLLIRSIDNAFNQLDFPEFTRNNDFGITYEAANPLMVTFEVGLGSFVDKVHARGNTGSLITKMIEVRPNSDEIKNLQAAFLDLYENVGTRLKSRVFEKRLLQKQKWLFIARDNVSDILARMVNKDTQALLVLSGESKTGLSYTRWYLGEMEEKLNCFKFLNLNLAEIGKLYSTQTITAAHIAEKIAAKLNMPFPGIKDFKFTNFIINLEARLDALAAQEEYWLFFVDQFDFHHDDDVKALVRSMGSIVLQPPSKFYLIFSAYKDWERDWNEEEADLAERLELSSFSEKEITLYLEKLYDCEEIDFRSKINKPTFIESARAILPATIYDSSEKSNVPAISNELKIWFRTTKTKLQL